MGKKVQPTDGTGTQKLRDTPMPSLPHSGSLSASAIPHQNLKDFNTLPGHPGAVSNGKLAGLLLLHSNLPKNYHSDLTERFEREISRKDGFRL
jgi:hypothetical protein